MTSTHPVISWPYWEWHLVAIYSKMVKKSKVPHCPTAFKHGKKADMSVEHNLHGIVVTEKWWFSSFSFVLNTCSYPWALVGSGVGVCVCVCVCVCVGGGGGGGGVHSPHFQHLDTHVNDHFCPPNLTKVSHFIQILLGPILNFKRCTPTDFQPERLCTHPPLDKWLVRISHLIKAEWPMCISKKGHHWFR